MDDELHRFKAINLAEFAASRGYLFVERERSTSGSWRGSTAASILMRHPGTDDKIVIRQDEDGHWIYFSVRDSADNGTIIDFLQRRHSRNLGIVRQELRSWIGEPPARVPPALPVYKDPEILRLRKRAAVLEAFKCLHVVDNNDYLNSRGISPETLRSDRFRGTWLEDDSANAIFPHRDGTAPDDVCGWEKKNKGFTGFAAGGYKTLWVSRAKRSDTKLVFVESAIDALSYYQLQIDSTTRYASTGGAIGELGADFVGRAIARMSPDATIVTATDRDLQGEKYALQIAQLAGGRSVLRHPSPIGKDWNDCLRDRIAKLPDQRVAR